MFFQLQIQPDEVTCIHDVVIQYDEPQTTWKRFIAFLVLAFLGRKTIPQKTVIHVIVEKRHAEKMKVVMKKTIEKGQVQKIAEEDQAAQPPWIMKTREQLRDTIAAIGKFIMTAFESGRESFPFILHADCIPKHQAKRFSKTAQETDDPHKISAWAAIKPLKIVQCELVFTAIQSFPSVDTSVLN